jgi:hypothetical protein
VKLTSGALAVFSPVALTPEVKTKLQSMGNELKYITAPDLEHHIFVSDWAEAYPGAHIIAPKGLLEKRNKDKSVRPVPFQTEVSNDNKTTLRISDEFDADFDFELVDAHPNKELVFLYKPERTLIQADYLFNLPATEQYSRSGEPATKGLLTRLVTKLQGTQGAAMGQKRLMWYAMSSGDRAGFAKSAQRINGWDFERIIPCHGDVIESGGKGIFRKIFEWHLQGQK